MNLSSLTQLNANDPLPALGRKVERASVMTHAEAFSALKQAAAEGFEIVDYGRLAGITEADCRQVKAQAAKSHITITIDIGKPDWAAALESWRQAVINEIGASFVFMRSEA